MRTVHYMIRKPDALGEVIYPSDLDPAEDYYGNGEFFLGGRNAAELAELYSFLAIWGERPVVVKLERRTGANFVANVEGVGEFWFTAKRLATLPRYTGQYSGFEDEQLIRQLVPADHRGLDAAVREHDFYFVGFSPRFEGTE
jgi:hypothetical protein